MDEPGVDFFISYSSPDTHWAEWIAWVLEEAKYRTIIQAWDFSAGRDFVLEMDRASKAAARTIAVLSPDYVRSRFASSEWAAAVAKGPEGSLIPVRVGLVELEGLLKNIIYVDLLGKDESEARGVLLKGVGGQRNKPSLKPVYPGSTPHRHATTRPRFPGDLGTTWVPPLLGALRPKVSQVQDDPQNWKRILIHLGGGGGVTGICYAVSKLFIEPYNGWITGLGIICAILTTGLLSNDFYPNKKGAISGVTAIAIFSVLLVFGEWTESISIKSGKSQEVAHPPIAQFQPPRFEPATMSYVDIDAGTLVSRLMRSNLSRCPPYVPGSPYPFPPTFPSALIP
jgi:hypothetical protein